MPMDSCRPKEREIQRLKARFYGLWVATTMPWRCASIRLLTRPQSFISNHELRIVTSVRKGTISVSGKVDGAQPGSTVEPRTTDAQGAVRPLGRAVVDAEGRWSLTAAFPKARQWSPRESSSVSPLGPACRCQGGSS